MKTRDIYKYIHTIFNQKIIITFRFKFLRHLIEVSSFQGDCLKRYSCIEHDDHMEIGGGMKNMRALMEIVDSGKRLKTIDKIQNGGE